MGWDATIGAVIDLDSLAIVTPTVEELTGRFKAQLAVQGILENPSLNGTIALGTVSSVLALGDAKLDLSDFQLSASLLGDDITIDKMTGRIGGGTFDGSGAIGTIFDPAHRHYDVKVEFEKAAITPLPEYSAVISGNLGVKKQPSASPQLHGAIEVVESLYEKTIELEDILSSIPQFLYGDFSSAHARGLESPSDGEELLFDVTVNAPATIGVDTNILHLQLSSNLELKGSNRKPMLDGTIAVVDGEFGFKDQNFSILSGELSWQDAKVVDPSLDIVGETEIFIPDTGNERVRIVVNGTLQDPKVDFVSDSGLSREAVLRAIGQGGSGGADITLLGKGRKAQNRSVGELLNPKSDLDLGERIAGLTGVSEVDVRTGISPATGAVVPRVVVTRPLGSRLVVNAESEVAGPRGSSLEVGYQLTPYLSILSGWSNRNSDDESNASRGSLGVGFRYRKTFPGWWLWSVDREKSAK